MSCCGRSMGASASSPTFPASVPVAPPSGTSGEIRRNAKFVDGLKTSAFPEVRTGYDAFQRGLRVSRDRPCLGYRPITGAKTVEVKDGEGKVVMGKDGKPQTKVESLVGDYIWFTYAQVQQKIDDFGSGLVNLGLLPVNDQGKRLLGLYARNRWEWVVSQHAAYAFSAGIVPLYDTLGQDALAFITCQTMMTCVCLSKTETPKLIAAKAAKGEEMVALTNAIQFEDVDDASRAAAAAVGINLRSFAEVCAAGASNRQAHTPPAPTDLAVICYTSGTTGNPKGAMLSHANAVADSSAAVWAELDITQEDIHLSYLPLAHVFEQLVELAFIMMGGCMGFYQGDTLKILEDLKALRPTVFPSVPRLFNRIYDRIMGGVTSEGGIKAALFNRAFADKRAYLAQGFVKHSVWDAIVFSKVAARVGLDRCKLLVTGSAPLAPHVMEFLRIVFATRMAEGYGQTECGGAATVTDIHDQASIGHVGAPLACNEVKLVSVEEMGYLVTDTVHGQEKDASGAIVKAGIKCTGRGEVCYRGPNVFSGYYKDAEKTAEALDAEGWLHSGDIGLWDEQGRIRIIDRKKNIFKLSQGEYVAAEKIENLYLRSEFVGQAFVYGDSLHSVLVGIVVPKEEKMKAWREAHPASGASAAGGSSLATDPEFKKEMMADMARIAKAAGLLGFEQVKDIHIDVNAWTPENILTPTFKLKRADAKRMYQAQIDAMYERLDPVAGRTGLKQGAV